MTQKEQEAREPVSVFLSYANEDESLRVQLGKPLRLLERAGLISTWHGRQVLAGSDQRQEIDEHLNTDPIILLLISPDFLGSDDCYVEMERALERRKHSQALVVPIILRPCNWQHTPLNGVKCLPPDGKAVTELANQDKAFSDITEDLRRAIEEYLKYDPRCPFRGLSHFRYEDRAFFFGREKLIAKLKDKLTEYNFLAVLGDSGSGKSSLVLAGLLPALRSNELDSQTDITPNHNPLGHTQASLAKIQVAYMIPDHDPLEQLQISLSKVQGQPVVLVVDQFEELFTLCSDEQLRQRFIERLFTLVDCEHRRVVITMRADFLGACAPYYKLKELMQKSLELIPPMDSTELRDAMEQQAFKVRLRFEVGLSDAILSDVQGEPGAMPLLQYALQKLWERRRGQYLLYKEYENIGKVRGAISTTANNFYSGLETEDQVRVRYIFEHLTHVDEDDLVQGRKVRDTRQRVELRKLVSPGSTLDQIEKLVKRLAGDGARLVVTSRDNVTNEKIVEVAHESLILHWPMLRQWLAESRANLKLQQQIEREACEWKDAGKVEDRLRFQGGPLQDASALAEKVTLSGHAQEYIKACQDLQEKRKVETKAQLITTLSALSETRFKDDQLGAFIHILKAARLLQQVKKDSPWLKEQLRVRTQVILLQTLGRIKEWNRLEGSGGRVFAVAYSPNGEMIATVNEGNLYFWKPDGTLLPSPALQGFGPVAFSNDGKMIALGRENGFLLWKLESGEVWEVSGNEVNSLAFSCDGKMIVTGENTKQSTGIVRLWKSDGTFLKNLAGLDCVITAVAFSPDSQLIIAGGWWGAWGLWKSDGTLVKVTWSSRGSLNALHFSPDSQIFITASNDGRAILCKRDGEELHILEDSRLGQGQGRAHADAIWGVRFSPDGKMIATVSTDRTVKLWESDGGLLTTLAGHKGVVRAVDFSPDNQVLASACDDGTVRLWKLSGASLKILDDHADEVYTVRFSPDGQTIVSASGHGWVRHWKPDGMLREVKRLHHGPISTLEFSSSGMMATASADRSIQVWQGDGSSLELNGHEGEVLSLSFSPNSAMIVTGGVDGTIKLWHADGSFVGNLGEHGGSILGVSFSANGDLIASASDDGTVKVWSKHGTLVQTLSEGRFPFTGVAFSPDSFPDDQIIAAASADGTVRLWKRDGTQLPSLEKHSNIVRALCFSPDGQFIATAGYDKTVKIWTRDGTLRSTLYGHDGYVNAVSFSPDGQTLASASNDTTVILWDLHQTLDLDGLMSDALNWMRAYLEHNPHVSKKDRDLILEGVWTGEM